MNLTPRKLRIFNSLARTLSFSRTATQFHLTQPSLTRIVREIEEDLGVLLFERTTRAVKLTPMGQDLVPFAGRLAEDYDNGVAEMMTAIKGQGQRLSLAALPSIAATLLLRPMLTLREEFPEAVIRAHDVLDQAALDLVRARRADLALTAVDVVDKDLDVEELWTEPYVALRPTSYPGELPTTWSHLEFEDVRVISMVRGTGIRTALERAFLDTGVTFRPVLEVTNLVTVARFVKVGYGVALLPYLGALSILDDGLEMHRLEGAPERKIGLIRRKGSTISPLQQRMIEMVREEASALRLY